MTDFNYGDIIEYIDCTLDENFNNARHWAEQHNTSFNELVERRELPKRYFQIGQEPTPTESELKERVKSVRDSYLQQTDYTQLQDAPLTEDEKETYREYRQYLRDYTEQEGWYNQNPMDFPTWKEQR